MSVPKSAHFMLDALLVGSFFAGMLAPPVAHLFLGGDGEGVRMEYRTPAALPELEFSTRFPRAFEAYWDDNFALRTEMVHWHNRIKLLGLGASPSPSFVVGREGWLFYTGERTIENHVGALRLSASELEQWKSVLEERRNWCAERGILYLFLVAPDKHAIYPEKLPSAYRHPERETLYEQFFAYFDEHSELRPIGLKERLLEARDEQELPLFYPLGTHWNDLGAWYAYDELMRRLGPELPELKPLERPRFVIDPSAKDDHFGSRLLLQELMPQDIVSMRPLRPICARLVAKKEPPQRIHVYECKERRDAPIVVMFHDSQGEWLEPYVADTFARSICVLKSSFDRELIEQEKPRVVIEEIGERRLWRVPKR